MIKSGAIPCKNKREKLISYLKLEYQPLKFSKVQSLPTYKKLEEDWNINLKKYVIPSSGKRIVYDKESLLAEYNRLKKIQFEENQKVRFQKYIDNNKKYLEDEQFWEFQTLQVFINDNPFDAAYTFLTSFEDVPDGEKCTLVGIIAKVQKKKDKNIKKIIPLFFHPTNDSFQRGISIHDCKNIIIYTGENVNGAPNQNKKSPHLGAGF